LFSSFLLLLLFSSFFLLIITDSHATAYDIALFIVFVLGNVMAASKSELLGGLFIVLYGVMQLEGVVTERNQGLLRKRGRGRRKK
jgi:hypothetical protein